MFANIRVSLMAVSCFLFFVPLLFTNTIFRFLSNVSSYKILTLIAMVLYSVFPHQSLQTNSGILV